MNPSLMRTACRPKGFRFTRFTAGLIIAAAGLAGCDGDNTGPGEGPVTATIEPGGSVVRLQLGEGAQFELEAPAGAVAEPITLILTPAEPSNGALASLRLQPASIPLLKPVTIRLTLSGSGELPDPTYAALAIGTSIEPATLLLATTAVGRTFTASTPVLGHQPPDASVAGGAQSLSPTMGVQLARLDDEAQIDLVIAHARARIEALERAFESLVRTNHFDEAVRVRMEASALAQLVGLDALAETGLQEAAVVACDGLSRRQNLAATGLEADFTALWGVLRPVLSWYATAQVLDLDDATCPAMATFDALLSDLVVQYVELYTAAMERAAFSHRVSDIEAELYSALLARPYGVLLGMPREFGLVKEQIQLPLARRLRTAAYGWCRSDYEQTHLGRLFRAARDREFPPPANLVRGYLGVDGQEDLDATAAELHEDIQLCATEVRYTHVAADGTRSGVSVRGGGSAPGNVHPAEEVVAAPGGTIELDGLLAALRCEPDGGGDSFVGDDRIVVEINGVTVRQLSPVGVTGHFIRAVPELLDVDELLAAGNVDSDVGGVAALAIRREGSSCGGAYSIPEADGALVTFSLRIPGSGPEVTIQPAAAVLGFGETAQFTATITGSNQDVTWTVTGGTHTASGNTVEYTAGNIRGTYAVTATSAADPAVSATAIVTISSQASSGAITLISIGGYAQTIIQSHASIACDDIDEYSYEEAFPSTRTISAQCSDTWTAAATDIPGTVTGSAAGGASYQLSEANGMLQSISASGSATASSTTQGGEGAPYGGKSEVDSDDVWFYFEVEGQVTVTLGGQVSSSSNLEFPRAYISLENTFTGTVAFTEQGSIGGTYVLPAGRYFLRGDAFADASSGLPDRPSSSANASFSVTMTVVP